MTQIKREEVAVKENLNNTALHFFKHPGYRAITVPMHLIEKIFVDFSATEPELVIQLYQVKEENHEST